MIKDVFPIGFEVEAFAEQALAIAKTYGFYVDSKALPRLQLSATGLSLLIKGFSPLKVDFEIQKFDRHHSLIRACKPKAGLHIMDVTSGWGRDAALLAYTGAKVTLIERQPIMAALLESGIAQCPSNLSLSLVYDDALHYLASLSPDQYPDLIYIDPMHPERQKSALVKKDMQALQQLFGPDEDAKALLELAIQRSPKVVVKWPQRSPSLLEPQERIAGKTVRFDIYKSSVKRV